MVIRWVLSAGVEERETAGKSGGHGMQVVAERAAVGEQCAGCSGCTSRAPGSVSSIRGRAVCGVKRPGGLRGLGQE